MCTTNRSSKPPLRFSANLCNLWWLRSVLKTNYSLSSTCFFAHKSIMAKVGRIVVWVNMTTTRPLFIVVAPLNLTEFFTKVPNWKTKDKYRTISLHQVQNCPNDDTSCTILVSNPIKILVWRLKPSSSLPNKRKENSLLPFPLFGVNQD